MKKRPSSAQCRRPSACVSLSQAIFTKFTDQKIEEHFWDKRMRTVFIILQYQNLNPVSKLRSIQFFPRY